MEEKFSPQKVFAFFILIFFAIIAITIGKYVASNKAQEIAIKKAIEEVESPQKEEFENIGLPIISVEQAKQQLRSLYVDIRTQEDYDLSHVRGSVHIRNFLPEKYPKIENIILIHEGKGDEQTKDSLLKLVESIPKKFDTKVLDGGYPSWLRSDGPIINKPNPDNLSDVAKMNPHEPRDIAPLLEVEGWENEISIIDTRNQLAFNKEHIAGAQNIQFGSLEEKRQEISPRKQIYVYGANDRESFEGAIRLFDLGFVEVKSIRGGFNAWKEFGYPTTQTQK